VRDLLREQLCFVHHSHSGEHQKNERQKKTAPGPLQGYDNNDIRIVINVMTKNTDSVSVKTLFTTLCWSATTVHHAHEADAWWRCWHCQNRRCSVGHTVFWSLVAGCTFIDLIVR
jgi:hypothetical protein